MRCTRCVGGGHRQANKETHHHADRRSKEHEAAIGRKVRGKGGGMTCEEMGEGGR